MTKWQITPGFPVHTWETNQYVKMFLRSLKLQALRGELVFQGGTFMNFQSRQLNHVESRQIVHTDIQIIQVFLKLKG